MLLEIYNKVVEIIGPVPLEIEFVYAICTIIFFIFVIYAVLLPFRVLYEGIFR